MNCFDSSFKRSDMLAREETLAMLLVAQLLRAPIAGEVVDV